MVIYIELSVCLCDICFVAGVHLLCICSAHRIRILGVNVWDGVQQRAGAQEVDAWEWECGMEGSRWLGRGKRMHESGCVGWSVGWSAGEI